jgi:hypothetical protein
MSSFRKTPMVRFVGRKESSPRNEIQSQVGLKPFPRTGCALHALASV